LTDVSTISQFKSEPFDNLSVTWRVNYLTI